MPSVKLCVTVRKRLKAKYSAAALGTIDAAVKKWVKADKDRGLTTVCVDLGDASGMKALGAKAVAGDVTAAKAKRAIDALWKQLNPDYLVLFGADDVVPYFRVKNPSFDGTNGDDDVEVPTDNPYACSKPFVAKKRGSYLIPDRTIGRIPDMVGDGDPGWLCDYLAVATASSPEPRSAYAGAYGICCDTWHGAGKASMKGIGEAEADLFVAPPIGDATDTARKRLASRLHMVKLHGAQLDPRFFGQQGPSFPVAFTSATLKARLTPKTLAAAMCCYGAQIYNPKDPAVGITNEWPIASTYLRKGALGFAGSTMIAWVGVEEPMCADWIVISYLKGLLLHGASLGRSLLESKQDFVRHIEQEGRTPDLPEEKTLIEFVLLGDPSIHPVLPPAPTPGPVAAGMRVALAAISAAGAEMERRTRRLFRSNMAEQMRKLLPVRSALVEKPTKQVRDLFSAVRALLGDETEEFGLRPEAVVSHRLESPAGAPRERPKGPVAASLATAAPVRRKSVEHYWSGRRIHDHVKDIRLVKVETDEQGNVIRSVALRSG